MCAAIVRVTRLFRFEAAHALENYDGACRNIHGHSYKLYVTIKGRIMQANEHPKDGMVVDFKELKRIVEKEVVAFFDHSLILKEDSQYSVHNRNGSDDKIFSVPFQPSSENLICYFADRIKSGLPSHLTLFSLKLAETENSYAEWFEEDQEHII